ncbi:MAG: UxaA family hydrolase, partial [Lachnospiraceae bacterium]|nr:UxaA family hydrolase [Lachnospiraceae bacterium]
KAGGITTLEDKSLGCVQKSGSAAVADVLKYGERVCTKGLNLLEGPGNDMVAVTALAAAGAHLILFTTGRGTPLSSPVPTVKVSSNSTLAGHKSNWIDFDAGRLVSTGIESAELSKELFDYVLEVASGKLVKSEEAGYHSMTIFKQGVTL